MYHFYVSVETKEDGAYNCVVVAPNDNIAQWKAKKYYQQEGYTVVDTDIQLFNTFEHGDYSDYEVIE